MLLSILALAAMIGVAYMSAVHGAYRAALTLVACVAAGCLAFGLMGPLAGWLGSDDPQSTWFFAADAFCLWAVFCTAFLGLRTATERLLSYEPDFPWIADRAGGLILGAGTGYLTVGLCIIVIQMLPTAPDFLGYEAFEDVHNPPKTGPHIKVRPGTPLWLEWDRGALNFWGYLSAESLGSNEQSVFARYGDLYPPKSERVEKYEAVLDADDFLYYHWFRRYDFIKWQTGALAGPLADTVRPSVANVELKVGQSGNILDFNVRIADVKRAAAIADFPDEKLAASEEYLLVTVSFRPLEKTPRQIDSTQFVIDELSNVRNKRQPMVYGLAKAATPENVMVVRGGSASEIAARDLRFGFAPGSTDGHYLASGALFHFTDARQFENRTFIYVLTKKALSATMHLSLASKPAPLPKTPPKPAVPKTPAPAKTPAATAPGTPTNPPPKAPAPATPAGAPAKATP